MKTMMLNSPFWGLLILRAPAGDPPAGDPPAGDPPAGDPPAGDPPAGDPPAGDPPAGDPPAGDPPAADPPAGDKPWYDTVEWTDPALKESMIKSGYHKGSVEEALQKALQGEQTAAKKLGRDPAALMDAPAKDQDISEWFKENGKSLGVPADPDGYDVKLPDDLPEGVPIDDKLLAAAKTAAHEVGMPPAMLQAMVNLHASNMTEAFTGLATKVTNAEAALDAELKEQWGGQYEDNTQMAARGFQALAASAGLEPAAAKNAAAQIEKQVGGAAMIKLFHHFAMQSGDDTLVTPKGGNAPALALADAEQRKQQIMAAHTGDMAKAAGNQSRINELKAELSALNKVITTHKS